MRHYIYKLIVTNNNIVVRTFFGNDPDELQERFEVWFIKQGYDRENIKTYLNYVQHANNR